MPAAEPACCIALADGRRLGVAVYGALGGEPVVYCHGFPTSRLEAALAHEPALCHGVRLIAFDRPGFGMSDFQPARCIADWPRDVIEAVDTLGIERFAVLGISGGAPYALACAAANPARVAAVAIVSGLGMCEAAPSVSDMNSFERGSLWLARNAPALSRLLNRQFALLLRRYSQQTIRLLASSMRPADRATLTDPVIRAGLANALREAFRHGGEGAAHELILYARPWEIALKAIRTPVYLWHGAQDVTVPVAMGRRLAAMLPNCRAEFLSGEGHYSLPARYVDAVLVWLGRCLQSRRAVCHKTDILQAL
jgi:pimeloyl-ACP methyl ester carboxylesterase